MSGLGHFRKAEPGRQTWTIDIVQFEFLFRTTNRNLVYAPRAMGVIGGRCCLVAAVQTLLLSLPVWM